MSLADEVRTVRQRVATRLSELEPLVREYQELLELAGELGIVPARDEAGARSVARDEAGATSVARDEAGARSVARDEASSKPARPRQRQSRAAAANEPPRGARMIEALRAKPGATIADLASILGVPATSLYRPVRELTSSGAIVKRGRGLYAAS